MFAAATIALASCGHGSPGSVLPPGIAPGVLTTRHAQSLTNGDVVAINVGGPASGAFAADEDGQGGTVSSTGDPINVTAANAAPAAVYQTQRYGPMTYTIPGLTPGTNYDVRLHFAETYFGLAGRSGAGQRHFNVALNGVAALTNFDVFAAAGAADTAVVRDFTTTANGSGTIVIALTNGNANYAILNGIEIIAASLVPATAIHVGGAAAGKFVADVDGQGGTVSGTTDGINVSAANAAPVAVYQTQRYGPMTYVVPGFTPGAGYTVRLHFAELYWGADGHPGGAGSRKFNVSINGTTAFTNLDVYATAGGAEKAVVLDTPSVADGSGRFTIALTNGSADNAMLNGIEVLGAQAQNDIQAVAIGGGSIGIFAADTLPNGGSNGTISTTSKTINVNVPNAAPEPVYQSQRYGAMQRVFTGLSAGATYTVRLHFAELYYSSAGARRFNVAINGAPELTNFDVFAAAGAANTAVVRDFSTTADGNGNIAVALTNGAADNPMLSGAEILGAGPGIALATETPKTSQAFVDSVGVNVHLSEYGTIYGNDFNLVQSLLQNSGIRHVRDGVTANNWTICNEDIALGAAGIHLDVISDGSPTDMASWLGCIGSAAESVEGLNEYDLSNDPHWAADLRSNTAALAQQFPQLPLVAPALTSEGAYATLGSMSGTVAFGNVHAYFAARNPGTTGWGSNFPPYGAYGSLAYNVNLGKVVSGTNPVDVTETGYSDAADQYAVPAVTKARYTLRTYLFNWNSGVARTYLYEFADEGSPQFSHYGIVDGAGNPKPVYVGLQSLLGHLSDPGPAFTPAPLSYDFMAPGTVAHTLLQKRNGTYELIFWNEVSEWDPNQNVPIGTTPQIVQLLFNKAPSALSQTTFSDSGSVTSGSLPSATLITLSASAWPTIVDITP